MGFTRKVMPVGSLGLVDFRSDKERTAAYTKGARKEARKQTAMMRAQTRAAKDVAKAQQQAALAQSRAVIAGQAQQQPQARAAAPGWYHDGQSLRWWDGQRWTDYRA